MASSKPQVVLTVDQALQLAKVLDAETVQALAEARDKLRRLFRLPPGTRG